MTDDLVRRANYALNDMQGRVEAGKLAVFEECIARIEELEDKLDEQEERIEELEAACEVVSSEFEGELWQVCRRLLGKTGFDVRAHEPDGIQADVFEDHMNEILAQRDADIARIEEYIRADFVDAIIAATFDLAEGKCAETLTMFENENPNRPDVMPYIDDACEACGDAIRALNTPETRAAILADAMKGKTDD